MKTLIIILALASSMWAEDKPKEDTAAQLAKAQHEIAALRETIRLMQDRESKVFSALNGCLGFPVQVPPPEVAPAEPDAKK